MKTANFANQPANGGMPPSEIRNAGERERGERRPAAESGEVADEQRRVLLRQPDRDGERAEVHHGVDDEVHHERSDELRVRDR